MVAALKQVKAGDKVEDVAREMGVSKHTLYSWKAKYGGMWLTANFVLDNESYTAYW
jgi:transposase